MNTMDNFIAVNEKAEGIIGKIFYFSTARILIPKTKFIEIGNAFGLPKFKPAKESKAGAYRNATTAIRDRVVVKDTSGTHVYCVYCRNNRHEDDNYIYRELVKETQGSRTNEYLKLANIIFDKQTETVRVENCVYDADVDVDAYCRQAEELFLQFCDCYSTKQVETVIMDQLERMQANKISVHGNFYFVPNPYLPLLNILEDYIETIAKHNLNDGRIVNNSLLVVDSERQREKMTEEFYANYRRDIEAYQKAIQSFIDNGCDSPKVIERWMQKIAALQQKKKTYEEVLQRQLDDLNSDYRLLQMQSQELYVRNVQGQIRMQAA